MGKIGLNKSELKIQEALLKGNFSEAREQLLCEDNVIHPVNRSIFKASLAFAEEDYGQAWKAIAEGLQIDRQNYELYVMLGEYYAARNLWQAYLCYENALFYCDDEEDSREIRQMMEDLLNAGIHVPKAAIVILSYNLLNMTGDCIESIRRTTLEDSREIIVVDNASVDGSVEWLRGQKDIKLLCNNENKGFPAACNQGIRLAEADSDIFLLNNDTVMTDNALFWLRMGLYEKETVGSTGSVSNFVSNRQAVVENGRDRQFYLDFARRNNVPSEEPYLPKVYLVGYALLIKRTVLDEVGLLDESFSPGNFEDNDLCLRIGLAGYSNVLCQNSFIIHWGSQSFGKEPEKYNNLMKANERFFFQKWTQIKMAPADYWGSQFLLGSFYEKYRPEEAHNIMVVGTGCGAFLSCLKDTYPNSRIYGMEQNQFLAKVANGIADTVWVNLDLWKSDELEETFDVIFLSETLGHVESPENVLKELVKMLKKDGLLIAGFINRNHYFNIMHPNASMRLFTHKQIMEMLYKAKMNVLVEACSQVGDDAERMESTLCRLQEKYPSITREELLTYQWLVAADKQRMDIQFNNKMVVCVLTYNHSDVVADVLANCAELYKRYGLDVYYYDSSEDGRTKEVIKSYQNAGYDNLYYIWIDNKELKSKRIFMMDGIQKEYDYMWYVKDRSWCGEKTLKLIYKAMEKYHDIIFLDAGHPDAPEELAICDDADAFYHRCGDYATSIDTTIYNVRTMLKDDFSMEEFEVKYDGEYGRSFRHFLLIFEQLSKKEKPDICLLSGKNMEIVNSRKGVSSWFDKRLEIWAKQWVQVNEALPDCYTDREDVIKRTASFSWILGDVNLLAELHDKGILTPEYFEEIKEYWRKVSDIPVQVLQDIAYGEYKNGVVDRR